MVYTNKNTKKIKHSTRRLKAGAAPITEAPEKELAPQNEQAGGTPSSSTAGASSETETVKVGDFKKKTKDNNKVKFNPLLFLLVGIISSYIIVSV